MGNFIRTRPVATFLPLAFLLSWYPAILGALGVERASGINPLGPFVAALIVCSAFGWPEVKALLLRLNPLRANWRWHVLALLLPAAIVAVAMTATVLIVPGSMNLAAMPDPAELPASLLFGLLFVGLGEEPGWRGFLTSRLGARFGWLQAALLVGVVWTLWHIPLWGTEFTWSQVPPFIVGVFAASVVLTWLLQRAGGNVFVCMLLHAAVNAVGAGFAFRMFEGGAHMLLWWTNTAAWVLVAVILGRSLLRGSQPVPAARTA